MRYNISRIFGMMVGIPVAIIAWMISIFGLDLSFIIDAVIGLGGFIVSYFPTQRLTSRKYLNEIGLTRREYRYVRGQLNQAQAKIRMILKSFINIRSIKDFRQVNDIYRISRSIYMSVKQRPGMFLK